MTVRLPIKSIKSREEVPTDTYGILTVVNKDINEEPDHNISKDDIYKARRVTIETLLKYKNNPDNLPEAFRKEFPGMTSEDYKDLGSLYAALSCKSTDTAVVLDPNKAEFHKSWRSHNAIDAAIMGDFDIKKITGMVAKAMTKLNIDAKNSNYFTQKEEAKSGRGIVER